MATLVTAPIFFGLASDTAFRGWVSGIINALAAVNPDILYQTDDTGQLDPLTVTVPAGTNTIAGSVVFKLDDGLAPVYIKIGFGKGGSSSTPRIQVTVGSGTDGASGVTGIMFGATLYDGVTTAPSGPIYVCAIKGFISMNLIATGGRAPGSHLLCFAVHRSTDDSGNPTASGLHGLACTGGTAQLQFWSSSWGGAAKYTQTNSSFITVVSVYNQSSLASGGKVKPMPTYALAPDVQIAAGMCGMRQNDVALNTEFEVAMVGATPRNFKDIGFSETGIAYPMLWE